MTEEVKEDKQVIAFVQAGNALTKWQKIIGGVALLASAGLGAVGQNYLINTNNVVVSLTQGPGGFMVEQGVPKDRIQLNAMALSHKFFEGITELTNNQGVLRHDICTNPEPDSVLLRQKFQDGLNILGNPTVDNALRARIRDVNGSGSVLSGAGLLTKETLLGMTRSEPLCPTDNVAAYMAVQHYGMALDGSANAAKMNAARLDEVKTKNPDEVTLLQAAQDKLAAGKQLYRKAKQVYHVVMN